ncbi:MAG TPA: V-type ATP synthase subunit D [Methanoregulaceae archaeon]|nr:V-type ATP synthase subunit D [Methanoregulaceae archaeon]HQJ88364.1 V-type ATP synthase subunit D [Methanoregulaceae archaeon]
MVYKRDVVPTRAELLALRRRIILVERGHRVLKMKQEVLLRELTRLIAEARMRRRTVFESYTRARRAIAIARMMEGSVGIRIAAVSVENPQEVTVSHRNVMGLSLPVLDAPDGIRPFHERGYGLPATGSVIDEAADEYERLVVAIVQAAETEGAIRRVADEAGRTRRKVNALEKRIIPDLISARDRIVAQRAELEREEFSRLYWVKKRKERTRELQR